jgi:hypothetical protein
VVQCQVGGLVSVLEQAEHRGMCHDMASVAVRPLLPVEADSSAGRAGIPEAIIPCQPAASPIQMREEHARLAFIRAADDDTVASGVDGNPRARQLQCVVRPH